MNTNRGELAQGALLPHIQSFAATQPVRRALAAKEQAVNQRFPVSVVAQALIYKGCLPVQILPCFGSSKSSIRHNLSRTISTNSTSPYEHFFHYTSGRWLWDEESQKRERFRVFNVQELQRIAAESVGAQSCVSITKLAEGGYNKVFRLVMDNGSVAIARIPNPNAGPACRTTASEVATMDFARTVLNIPVPKVFAWSATANNPVEAEYIIMEEAPGTHLEDVWDDKKVSDKANIVKGLVEIEKKLLSVSFTRYGNIYFASDSFPGCEAAKVVGDISADLKRVVEERFTIGPVVDRDFWNGKRASMAIDRGPWESPQDYLTAIANREIAWISSFALPKPPKDIFLASEAQNSPSHHISLYKMFLHVIPYLLPQNKKLSPPTLWHWDIHSANLFVEGNRITSLIDWQDTWVGPLFLQFRHPKLVDYDGEVLLKLPENYESLEEGEAKARTRKQVEKSIVLYTYETETDKNNPLLSEILRLHHGRTRRETVQFAANTWDGDIIPFRQCLIRIERHWDELGFDTPCPIHFTEEELQAHYRDGEGWNERADFWDSLAGLVGRDGWTSNETYDQALEMFAELREEGLKNLTGKERVDFEAQTRWAERKVSSVC
ncbi:Altered inheritance of mitochondria protein, mitochondrial [Lachnellula hyalina]|uniref:Altered inheritance of mitochondria protein, mitochondrial n=1 Tax=Lachnellula hyalina TaxID=1316788 RepID=A0A8H8U0P5_9HELO|nr:Altered inheritance of mitochondria protein, mitochondrial [Lachnellula hyalina]TVY26231.1 Altered inheritance of mitochondria protein, mitochondrial [Lachnellula hyalina]